LTTTTGMALMLCRKCGIIISPEWPYEYHIGCYPDFERMPGFDMTSYDLELREDLIEIVNWAHRAIPRSQQVSLGCSEVGQECDLRVAYKMAAMPEINTSQDPWPAIVGTSIHSWMEQAVNDFEQVHSIRKWFTEMEVAPSPLVKGHTDLYDAHRFAVLDWKFPSPDNLKKMRADGPSHQYQVQVQLYGLGHLNAGRRVDRVGIVALGRQGWLKDMYVWTTEFDQKLAEAALQRIYDLGNRMIAIGLPEAPTWDMLPRTPTRLCTWCPYYNRDESKPGANGCPGK
jgi:hypothetical protein